MVRASRLKPWNTKPMKVPPQQRALIAVEVVRRAPSRNGTSRVVGTSRQPRMFIMVDLPEPLGPMIATNSPCAIVEVDAAQRLERGRRPAP